MKDFVDFILKKMRMRGEFSFPQKALVFIDEKISNELERAGLLEKFEIINVFSEKIKTGDSKDIFREKNKHRFDIIIVENDQHTERIVGNLVNRCVFESSYVFINNWDKGEVFFDKTTPETLKGLFRLECCGSFVSITPEIFFISKMAAYAYFDEPPYKEFIPGIVPYEELDDMVFCAEASMIAGNKMVVGMIKDNLKEQEKLGNYIDQDLNFCIIGMPSGEEYDNNDQIPFLSHQFDVGIYIDFSNNRNDSALVKWGNEQLLPTKLLHYLRVLLPHSAREIQRILKISSCESNNDASIISREIGGKRYSLYAITVGQYIPSQRGCCTFACYYLDAIDSKIEKIQKITTALYSQQSSFILNDARRRFLRASTQSAIGSIMSRNGSHNIGSHVLASLTHNVGSMPDDRILYQYIQQRMDYIANVTTDPPGWSVPTMFVGDIMKTFFSQRNLLEYIAGSEGLCAYKFQDPNMGKEERINQTDTIKIHIRRIAEGICQKSTNNNFNQLKYNWAHAQKAGENALHIIPYPDIPFIDYQEDKPLQLEYDTPLAIPGGIVGEHAIFTILENFIRNAAKHGWSVTRNQRKKQEQEQENVKEKGQEQNLEIYIDFIDDPGKDDVEFTIWDNMSDVFADFRFKEDMLSDHDESEENREETLQIREGDWDPDKCARFISALPEDQTRFDADLYLLCRIYVLAVKKQEISEMLSREANKETETENRLSRKLDEINKELNRLQQKIGQQTDKQALFGLDHAFTEAGTNTDLPVRIEEIRRDIQTGIRKIDKFEEKLLEKPNDNEIASLKKIPDLDMPLHFRQQILLNEPLINDDGRLRRENWGLAEMKISACYLQNRPLGEVGGLEPLKKTDDYVIFPVAMPGVCKYSEENGGIRCEEKQKQCTEKDCPIETKRYHLGFRFKVPKPREILIVLNKEKDLEVVTDTNNPKVSKYKENGIYFTSSEVLCSKDKDAPVEDFDFDYVVFLNKRSAQDCGNSILEKRANQNGEEKPPTDIEAIWKSYFPIRLLTKDVLKDITLTEPEKAIPVIKEKVYAAWLEKIRNSRKSESRTNAITLQLKTTDNKKKTNNASGSQGLTTDKDVLRFVFQNNFHSILANLLEKPPVEMDCFSELILYLLKACPEPDKEIPASNEGPKTVIRKTLRNLCRKLKEALCPDLEKTDDESKMSSDSISERIDPKAVVFLNTIKSEYNDLLRAKLDAFCPLKKKERKPGDVSEVLVQSIQNAFDTCKTILCKHEESIHTLPHGYSVATRPEQSEQSDKSESSIISADLMWNELGQPVDPLKGLKEKLARLNITIVGEESKEGINIKYCRHDYVCSKGCLYAEALSGSQSYLNILSRIMHPVKGSQDNPENHIGMFVRLVENAFLRLLIIDERVLKFLKSHSDISKRFQSMNIDVADFSDTPVAAQDGRMLYLHALDLFFSSNQEKVDNEQNSGDVNINVQTVNNQIPVGKNNSLTNEWDLLIIHQGIIDKWFPNSHSKESVGKLIQNIQKSGVCKHVIITSGRGRPNNIPGYVKMIPFSMLESTLFRNYPEKLTLVTAAMNALPNKTGI